MQNYFFLLLQNSIPLKSGGEVNSKESVAPAGEMLWFFTKSDEESLFSSSDDLKVVIKSFKRLCNRLPAGVFAKLDATTEDFLSVTSRYDEFGISTLGEDSSNFVTKLFKMGGVANVVISGVASENKPEIKACLYCKHYET